MDGPRELVPSVSMMPREKADIILNRISIGNIRSYRKSDDTVAFYCGRKNVSWGLRESPLHNMHNIGLCRSCKSAHSIGASTLPYFESDFRALVGLKQPGILNELRDIWKAATAGKKVILLCWCDPAPCHTQIVKTILRELVIQDS